MFLKFLTVNDVNILNKGDDTTFVTSSKAEVTNMTLNNDFTNFNTVNCQVSEEASLSDHKSIVYRLEFLRLVTQRIKSHS